MDNRCICCGEIIPEGMLACPNCLVVSKRQATENKWIPVRERLPERGQEVIVYAGGILEPFVYAYCFWNKDYCSFQHITHWMPLPEPPKEEK